MFSLLRPHITHRTSPSIPILGRPLRNILMSPYELEDGELRRRSRLSMG